MNLAEAFKITVENKTAEQVWNEAIQMKMDGNRVIKNISLGINTRTVEFIDDSTYTHPDWSKQDV